MYDFDLFVIGAGSGGVRAARMAAGLGARVAIAEERQAGGTCVNVGCIPKKLYSMAAHYHYDFEDSAGFGWELPGARFDWKRLRDNKKREISRLNGIYESLLEQSGVVYCRGRAKLHDPHTVDVAGQLHTAKYILLATGGWPYVPDFPGRELVLTSNEIFDLPELPKRLLIVGGGYIAVEFAGIFAGLGVETSLSYRAELPLRDFDEDLRTRFVKEAGKHVRLLPQTEVQSISKTAAGLQVLLRDGVSCHVDCVLFATGRRANTAALGLEKVPLRLRENGAVVVDESLRTSASSIYALGDVVGHMALTPVALAEGMLLANHLFGDRTRTLSYQGIPTTVFSHPNIGTVGLSEAQALDRHRELKIFESDFRALRHTLSGRDERTYMKLIVDGPSDRVLGMHMLGPDAGEIIQGFAAAMTCGVTKTQLDNTLGIHPTLAEEFVTMRTPARVVRK
jgi:glutathione reductase (NADPH)